MALKEDYLDDIIDTSVNEKRKYRIINNADSTISLEDVTEYLQNGDNFSSADVNAITKILNKLNESGVNVRYNSETDFFEVKDENGEWVSTKIRAGLNELYLYDNGDSCTDVGGAWKSYASKPSTDTATVKNIAFTLGETSMTLGDNGANYGGTIFKENSIDLTNYDKFYIDWTIIMRNVASGSNNNGVLSVVVANSKENDYEVLASIRHRNENVEGKEYIDTSALNGKFYIGIFSYSYVAYGDTSIRAIWLE